MRKFTLGTVALLLFAYSPAFATEGQPLLDQAKKERVPRFAYARDAGAQVQLTPDGRSFYILWEPEGKMDVPMIVTIHGHGSWAADEFFLWHPYAKQRGYGVLALQWWFGEGERYQDYFNPAEMYRNIDQILKKEGITPGRSLFHGFSRGAANTYGVAAMDVDSQNRYFAVFVANSGKPSPGFPPNEEIAGGKFGPAPLRDTRWITYAGAKDTHPDRDGFEGMREAKQWIEKYGGAVILAIEDPDGDHGSFHRNPDNVNKALDEFEKLI